MFLINRIEYKRKRIVRIIVSFKNGQHSSGSGFFINHDGDILTCFHVAFGKVLSLLIKDLEYIKAPGKDDKEKLENFHKTTIDKIEVELLDGSKRKAILKNFDQNYDIALIGLDGKLSGINFFQLNYNDVLNYGDKIFFCGFQYEVGYLSEKFPFSVNTGIISSFPEAIIGGKKYTHLKINSINLGGNSGAPLFLKNSNKVIGIINGNMMWGNQGVGIYDRNGQIKPTPFEVPLAIAYATQLKLLKEKTNILD